MPGSFHYLPLYVCNALPLVIAFRSPLSPETFPRLEDEIDAWMRIEIYKKIVERLKDSDCLGILSLDVRILLKYTVEV